MKETKKHCDLATCAMCRFCLKDWLPAIDINRKNYEVKKGQIIFNEGDTVQGIYFVYSGTVKVHKQWGGDKELIIRFAKRGDIFGHRGLGEETVYPVSATAIEQSVVCFIKLDFFLSTLKVNNEYLFKLMMFFAEDLNICERRRRDLAHMPVKGRIASSLLALSKKFGISANGHIDILLSRQDLASYAGTTYETLFRTLNELAEEKIIRQSGKEITILDADQLMAVASLRL